MEWYLKVFHSYSTFSGRAGKEEFWTFNIFNALFSIAAIFIDYILGTYIILFSIYFIVMFPPALTVLVRRLHDIGKTGKWCFIVLVPVLGAIWLIIVLAKQGNIGENLYGSDPKAVD